MVFTKPVTVIFDNCVWNFVYFSECVFKQQVIVKQTGIESIKNIVSFEESKVQGVILESRVRIEIDALTNFKFIAQSFDNE